MAPPSPDWLMHRTKPFGKPVWWREAMQVSLVASLLRIHRASEKGTPSEPRTSPKST